MSEKEITEQAERMWPEYHGDYPPDDVPWMPQRLPKMNGPVRLADGTVITPKEGVKFDSGKRRVDLVPTEAINALADVLTAGAVKYGEHNWRNGMDWSRVYGAAQRHLLAFWGGDDIDEESGMPHLWHALTNIAFLVSYQTMSVGRDNRWKQDDDGGAQVDCSA